jgi:23S rRNA (cytosine1962-C5)-methyltransferase
VRTLEGLDLVTEPEVLGKAPAPQTKIRLRPLFPGSQLLHLETSLLDGQKTGFFLDQAAPLARSLSWLAGSLKGLKRVRILDVCCYVGQWGAQWAHLLCQLGIEVEVFGVDASTPALTLAKKNVEAQGAFFTALKFDVMDRKGWEEVPECELVLLDPPALIKSRKDLMVGTKAYLKLGRLAVLKATHGFVFSSCSRLMDAARFEGLIQKIGLEHQVLWLGQETQSPDHPIRPGFPESHYLKSWVGLIKRGSRHEERDARRIRCRE